MHCWLWGHPRLCCALVLYSVHCALQAAPRPSGWSITEDQGLVFRAQSTSQVYHKHAWRLRGILYGALQDPPDPCAEQDPGLGVLQLPQDIENNQDTNCEF